MRYEVRVRTRKRRLRKPFKLARGAVTRVTSIVCEITGDGHRGRGEATGVSYKGENWRSMTDQVMAMADDIRRGVGRDELRRRMPPGGARNAIDGALWDLEAKQRGKTVWDLAGIAPGPVDTAYTVGIDTPDNMRADARRHAGFPVIKVKVSGDDPLARVRAVREGAPMAEIIVDANQAWCIEALETYSSPLADLGVALIEQPLHRERDEALDGFESPVPLCADESCATRSDLDRVAGRYSAVNIKLDKTGGLTEALALAEAAKSMGLELMVGNMMGTSLAMAPALVVAQSCRWVDLDGPLLLWWDGWHRLRYAGSRIQVFEPRLWG